MIKLFKAHHGEVNIHEILSIPRKAKEVKIEKDFIIVGESETHGNDHRVAVLDREKIKFYEKDGILYMKNLEETEIYCPHKERHSPQTLPPSIYKFTKRKEYDYLTQEIRQVQD